MRNLNNLCCLVVYRFTVFPSTLSTYLMPMLSSWKMDTKSKIIFLREVLARKVDLFSKTDSKHKDEM